MKKFLLLLCILAAANYAHAFTSQGKWRWRKDDGDEKTATFLADTNTTLTISNTDNIRLRTEFYNANSDDKTIDNTKLSYSLTGAEGSWILISDTIANKDFALSKSTFITNLEATTQQLPARDGYTFQAGKVIDDTISYAYTMPTKKSTEFEWVIKPTSTVKLNTTYYFETSVGGYDQPLPTLKIGSVLAVNLTNFSVEQQGSKVLIKWNTSSENNNDHFDVLRSADGRNWQTIATVAAKTSGDTKPVNYEATDNNPLNGINYYRLKQSDKDGKSALLQIKSLNISLNKIIATVYPNPATNFINIQIQNYSGAFTATLINGSGTTIGRQTFDAVLTTSSYKYTPNTKLPAGIYYLMLTGNNLSQKLKVIVQ